MKLNLHVIKDELCDLSVQAALRLDPFERTLLFACPLSGSETLRNDRLYIASPDQMSRIPPRKIPGGPSFLLSGPPIDLPLPEQCNIAWTLEPTPKEMLVTRLNEVFAAYDQWHHDLEGVIVKGKPIRQLGEIGMQMLGGPIWLWDDQHQTIFHTVNCKTEKLPPGYVIHEDLSSWPLWEVNAWLEGVKNGSVNMELARSAKKPYTLPATKDFPYRSLCSNVFIGDQYAATISLDEIGKPFTIREEILLDFLGGLLSHALKRDLNVNTSTTFVMGKCISGLLANQPVKHSELRSAAQGARWSTGDPFLCIVAEPINPLYTGGILSQTGEKLARTFDGIAYAIASNAIVLVVNLSKSELGVSEVIARILHELQKRKCRTQMGVSTVFDNLEDLFVHYRQCIKALEYGHDHYPECEDIVYYRYDEFLTESIIQNIRDHATPEAVCPIGLRQLIDYDEKHGTSLTVTLNEYLDNNMVVSETSRKLAVHRNTLIGKLKRIVEIIGMDLDDADTRFAIMLALRALGVHRR